MKTNEAIKWQEVQALQRYQLIAPCWMESLGQCKADPAAGSNRRTERAVPTNLYRYEAAYRKGGFPGLKPQDPGIKALPETPGKL